MAKKHSTKTATKEAQQASVPKIQAYQQWAGMKIDDKPEDWTSESEYRQDDLPSNYWMVQNNLVCCSNGTVETRPEDLTICEAPSGKTFTGVAYMWRHYIFAAFTDNTIAMYDINYPSLGWSFIDVVCWTNVITNSEDNGFELSQSKSEFLPSTYGMWSNIYVYGVNYVETLICQTSICPDTHYNEKSNDLIIDNSNMFTADLTDISKRELTLENGQYIPAPSASNLSIISNNSLSTDPEDITEIILKPEDVSSAASQETIMFAYINKYGMTQFDGFSWESDMQVADHKYVNLSVGPANFTPSCHLQLTLTGIPKDKGIEAIAFYDCEDDSTDPIFIGMVEVDEFIYNEDTKTYTATYDWLGSMADTDKWENANLSPDGVNTTMGCPGSYCRQHDGRIYVWGDKKKPYRLGILGNVKNELSYSIGMGAGFLDIEPGTGCEITSVEKYKTTSGASIVTILTHHPNTRLTKRYNLIETNITVTSEIAEQSWQYEEVSNVIGSNSVWGSGVWEDGLYTLGRYGLAVTTMAMEYNSQLKSQYISQNIDPVFDENFGEMINNARMIHVKDKTYFVFAQAKSAYTYTASDKTEYINDNTPTVLEPIIFCYDHGVNAWYTFSYPTEENIRHLINIDFEGDNEGIGIICDNHMAMIPMAGPAPYWEIKAKRTKAYQELQQYGDEYKANIETAAKSFLQSKSEFNKTQAGKIKQTDWIFSDAYNSAVSEVEDTLGTSVVAFKFYRNPTNDTYNSLIEYLVDGFVEQYTENYHNTLEYKAYNSQESLDTDSLLMTGEMATSSPGVNQDYVAQLEFRFDYFYGDMDIDLDGYDYYGRNINVHKHIHRDEIDHGTVEWMRVNKLLENYHLTIKATAHYRLEAILVKHYTQSATINLPYGYDASVGYKTRLGADKEARHYLRNYNNLKDTILT